MSGGRRLSPGDAEVAVFESSISLTDKCQLFTLDAEFRSASGEGGGRRVPVTQSLAFALLHVRPQAAGTQSEGPGRQVEHHAI